MTATLRRGAGSLLHLKRFAWAGAAAGVRQDRPPFDLTEICDEGPDSPGESRRPANRTTPTSAPPKPHYRPANYAGKHGNASSQMPKCQFLRMLPSLVLGHSSCAAAPVT
ncbi:hypothetical protein FB567DRAFT_552357 [Paraphoma chrysanthemicola]|uniref:Uncharacterized protein n=1 Tax=Paraphoma chrysanthemicola TaxID=798071 RepID=A0A8K0VUG2_9PLEO|nr:hypothetical protein FB567DRAFT_552357 [Paraphoma chrysanthemicola]